MSVPAEKDYTEFVAARLTALRRIAHHLCGDAHRADDLVQDTITKLYVRWPLRSVDNLDGYVRTMLVRTYLDEQRRSWWKVRLFSSPPDEPTPPDSGIENRAMLHEVLARIPDRQRAVLVLRFLCDLPVTEVAAALGCSTGTVKSQTTHGLTAMRRLLDERSADEESTMKGTAR